MCYAYPAVVKYLMIEFQEYLYTLQKVVRTIEPGVKVEFRNSNTVSRTKPADAATTKAAT